MYAEINNSRCILMIGKEEVGIVLRVAAENKVSIFCCRCEMIITREANPCSCLIDLKIEWYCKDSNDAEILCSGIKKKENNKRRLWYRRDLEYQSYGISTKSDLDSILQIQEAKCIYCLCPLIKYEKDHIIPLCSGGTFWPSNFAIACVPCNQKKGGMPANRFYQNSNVPHINAWRKCVRQKRLIIDKSRKALVKDYINGLKVLMQRLYSKSADIYYEKDQCGFEYQGFYLDLPPGIIRKWYPNNDGPLLSFKYFILLRENI